MYRLFVKRLLDILFSGILLFLLLPIYLILILSIYVKLGSPAFFRQERPGKNEELFWLVKFRTMTNKTDNNGELLPDSERLTPFGRFLRSTSLDELPEFWNIFKGDMSRGYLKEIQHNILWSKTKFYLQSTNEARLW